MNPEIVAALVASGAAIVSGVLAGSISWLASRSTLRAEIAKMRLGLRHVQAQPLQSERLRTYPDLYKLLSDTVKRIEEQGLQGVDWRELKAKVDAWDSSHALLLSVPSTRALYQFRQDLSLLISRGAPPGSAAPYSDFYHQIGKLELALKADLAVFGLDLYSPERIWETYSEIEQEYDRTQRSR